MNIKDRLFADMNAALRDGDKPALGTIRLLRASITDQEKDKLRPLTDDEVLELAAQAVRRRREAIEQFRRGNRPDLVAREEHEITVIERYLPPPMSADDLRSLVHDAVSQSGASQPKDIGKVMALLMPQLKGRGADGKEVQRLVRERLESSGAS